MDARSEQEAIRPRLILTTPIIEDAAAFAPSLAAACGAADVAGVVLRLKTAGDAELLEKIRALAPGVHRVGAALILEDLVQLVNTVNADGAHITKSDALAAARGALKGDHILGAGRLESRHDAMTAGESGADYVLFGEPDANGRRPTMPSLTERVTWWAEVFIIPCVAYAAHIDEIAPLVRAGADFIALGDEVIWGTAEDPAAALAAASVYLGVAERVS
ncbi:MAG: thiamine phosphate synthase [Xanthobacteraceae bacterium]